MRVFVVVAAMLFCMAGCSRKEIQKSVVVEPRESVTNSIGMELIEISSGKFTMGDGAGVAVTLTKPFGLGKTEVTQGQWKSVMGTMPWFGKYFGNNLIQTDEDCPAIGVSWEDATEFCKKLTAIERKAGKLKADEEYRLPTEAQWEYACRAGTTTAFSFGDLDYKKLGEHAWFEDNTKNVDKNVDEQYAHNVGLKKPNPWGLHDMHGNVWEWCSDWYGEKLSGGTDPVGPDGGSPNKNGVVVPYRVVRSGGWGSFGHDCHSAYRSYESTDTHSNSTGFRVARSQSIQ